MRSSFILFISFLLPGAYASTYQLTDNNVGTDFLSTFTFEAIADPTNGRVNYVDQGTALSQNLTYANGDTLILRADYWTVLDPNGPGRNSVRIRSVKTYTTHVSVFDIRHMPQGCGTWPAAWETNESNWPAGGEVDIGVNDQGADSITVHTDPGCTMPSSGRVMTGEAGNLDCEGSSGCGVSATQANSYGPSFNANGGGFYAMERTDAFINVWFFPRNGAPSDLASGASSVDTDNWGTPSASFPNTDCNVGEMFDENNIIINLTFCGDWAGAVYASSGCPSTCTDYVNNNPSAFVNAYWDIAAVRVYQSSTSVRIHPNGDTSKCLDVQGDVLANGTPVQIYDCNGTGAQNWVMDSGTTAVQLAGTNYCLDAGDSPENGTQMKIWECYSGIAAQTWTNSNNRITLQSEGQCLDDNNGSVADGTILQIWACGASDNFQVWTTS